MKLPALFIVMLATGWSNLTVAQDVDHGAVYYKVCAGCHGFKGEGSKQVGAPALAGQETWYLERQIRNYHSGARGAGGDDPAGQRMGVISVSVADDERIADVVAYIATLPVARPEASVPGDVEKGRALYVPCAACHGAQGEGNVALNAPALRNLEDWYQLSQLLKFRNGQRGTHASDVFGQQMVPLARALGDDQAVRDVTAYVATFAN